MLEIGVFLNQVYFKIEKNKENCQVLFQVESFKNPISSTDKEVGKVHIF